ncbi:MAG: ferredoxin--NADP reductase [Saprospiraceae bacterium]|nr:ferredoxin--NADP reductase [Saprospiraceae bacterium]
MAKDTTFYDLTICDIVHETDAAISVYLDVPDSLKDTFRFKAGQYLTFRMHINGQEVRRSYSLCTSPDEPAPAVTVKRVKGGLVSNFIHDNLKVGSTLEVMPPDGRFTIEPDPERRRSYYFIGAGSGITPLMSQIKCLLEHEPMSTLHLFYGNRDLDSIIFKETLEKLSETHEGQLTVDHILSKPVKRGLFGLGKSKGPVWTGPRGRIDADHLGTWLDTYPAQQGGLYLICGPGNMIETVRQALLRRGVDEANIRAEYFTPADQPASKMASAGPVDKATLTAHLNGETITIPIAEKTVLETLQDAGYDPPFSCTSGACATCMAKVLKGSVEMEMCFALNDAEVEDGYVLTCQSHPTSEQLELTYDV